MRLLFEACLFYFGLCYSNITVLYFLNTSDYYVDYLGTGDFLTRLVLLLKFIFDLSIFWIWDFLGEVTWLIQGDFSSLLKQSFMLSLSNLRTLFWMSIALFKIFALLFYMNSADTPYEASTVAIVDSTKAWEIIAVCECICFISLKIISMSFLLLFVARQSRN